MEIDIKIDDKKASEIKRLILNLLNPSGKLDCGAAFKFAAIYPYPFARREISYDACIYA